VEFTYFLKGKLKNILNSFDYFRRSFGDQYGWQTLCDRFGLLGRWLCSSPSSWRLHQRSQLHGLGGGNALLTAAVAAAAVMAEEEKRLHNLMSQKLYSFFYIDCRDFSVFFFFLSFLKVVFYENKAF